MFYTPYESATPDYSDEESLSRWPEIILSRNSFKINRPCSALREKKIGNSGVMKILGNNIFKVPFFNKFPTRYHHQCPAAAVQVVTDITKMKRRNFIRKLICWIKLLPVSLGTLLRINGYIRRIEAFERFYAGKECREYCVGKSTNISRIKSDVQQLRDIVKW